MLHNNNQFGTNEVPMSGEANMTSEIVNPNNVNNLGKIPQQMPLPVNPSCNLSEFPYGLNMNAGMNQYHNLSSGFPQSLMPQNSMNWPSNIFPMNLNVQNGPFETPVENKCYQKEANLLNVPQIPKYKPDSHINNYAQFNNSLFNNQHYRPVHASYEDNNINKHINTEDYKQYLENNLGLSVKVSENDFNSSKIPKPIDNCLAKDNIVKENEVTPVTGPESCTSNNVVQDIMAKSTNESNASELDSFNLKTFKDSDSRKRSLEKTLRMLEISIINSTNSRKNPENSNKDSNTKSIDQTLNLSEKSYELSQANPTPTVECPGQEGDKSNQEIPNQTSYNDSDEDMLSITKIKQETLTTVEIKLEDLSGEAEPNPFQRDIFGVQSEHVYNCHILDSENGVNIAKEMIKSGGTTESYFECPYCSLYFNNPKRYLIHIKWHSFGLTNDKRLELQRQKEMKKLMKKEARIQLKRQSEDKKDNDGPNKCTVCQKEFNTYSSLKTHRQKMHPTRTRTCKICNKNVLGWLAMKQHMTTHEEASFNCTECPKRFKHAHSLAKHKDTHKEKIHGCAQCPKKFGSATLLNIHMKTHERMIRGATFRCTYCGKGYYESFSLAAHERTHRNEKPFTCDICNSRFGTNSSLKRHLKVSHNTTKPYECRTCHRCFMQESIRDRHELRLHSDPEDFKYPCNLCTSKFIEMKDLKKHLYKVHPKVKRKKHSDDDYSE